jgi:hypothetical protein
MNNTTRARGIAGLLVVAAAGLIAILVVYGPRPGIYHPTPPRTPPATPTKTTHPITPPTTVPVVPTPSPSIPASLTQTATTVAADVNIGILPPQKDVSPQMWAVISSPTASPPPPATITSPPQATYQGGGTGWAIFLVTEGINNISLVDDVVLQDINNTWVVTDMPGTLTPTSGATS